MGKFLEGLGDELRLYVRHLAWLNTTPDKPEGSKADHKEVTRREAFDRDGKEIDLPPCDADYLIGYLFEVGPRVGEGAVTHSEIEAWQRNTGIDLDAWEARMVRTLSVEYLNESYKAKARDCPAPWGDIPVPNVKAESIRDAIRALANL